MQGCFVGCEITRVAEEDGTIVGGHVQQLGPSGMELTQTDTLTPPLPLLSLYIPLAQWLSL